MSALTFNASGIGLHPVFLLLSPIRTTSKGNWDQTLMPSLNGIVRDCLLGSADARVALDREMRPLLKASLMSRGATASHAEVLAAVVLSDCFLPGEQSLLSRFDGNRDFGSWLSRVAINRFLDELHIEKLLSRGGHDPDLAEKGNPVKDQFAILLRDIVRKALAEALASREPQVRVILWLTYVHNVKQSRLAQVWGWSESELSQTISSNLDALRDKTLSAILRIDPSLPILWEDVVDACADGEASLISS